MSNNAPKLSQEFVLLLPKQRTALIVSLDEWHHIKTKIGKLKFDQFWVNSIGSSLLGICLTSIFDTGLRLDALVSPERINSFMNARFFIPFLAFGCLIYAHNQKKVEQARVNEVVEQMKLIEDRFEKELGQSP